MWRTLNTDKSSASTIALLLVKAHGKRAGEVAADKFAECKQCDDAEGMAFCVQVLLNVRQLGKDRTAESSNTGARCDARV